METSNKKILLIAMYSVPLFLTIMCSIKRNKKLKQNMITENEVSDILGEELPDINNELEKLSNSGNMYKAMQCFADFTKQLIRKGNLAEVKHCFNIAEKLLNDGNNQVKNAVENVYVYAMGTVIEFSATTTNRLQEIFNGSLKKEYIRQVLAKGI